MLNQSILLLCYYSSMLIEKARTLSGFSTENPRLSYGGITIPYLAVGFSVLLMFLQACISDVVDAGRPEISIRLGSREVK